MQITVTANGQSQTATLTNNKSAQAFYQLVSQKDITIKMSDYGNFEKVGALGQKSTIIKTHGISPYSAILMVPQSKACRLF